MNPRKTSVLPTLLQILGVVLNKNLSVRQLASTWYGTRASLKQAESVTPYGVRKHLADSLIVSPAIPLD